MRRALAGAQLAAAALALARLARGRARRAPLHALAPGTAAPGAAEGRAVPGVTAPGGHARSPRISVVVPARDEAARIGPCLDGLRGDPDVAEVLVVDDCSTDGTAAVARAHGARVLAGREPPPGWVGKPWALQQGLEAAAGDVVVSVDADTRPRPGLARALAEALRDADLVTAGARFACDTAGERLLHPSMLATLVYRFGPADATRRPRPVRAISNGQCTAVRRADLLAAGGYALAAGHMTDDAALARGLAGRGWRIAFHDGAALIDVDMHDSAREVWDEWGRSLAMPDVTPPAWQAADLGIVWLVMALPVLRLATARATRLDVALLAVRAALLVALRPAYVRRGAPFWLSPLADPATAVRFTASALRPTRAWRGRTYGPGARRARTARR